MQGQRHDRTCGDAERIARHKLVIPRIRKADAVDHQVCCLSRTVMPIVLQQNAVFGHACVDCACDCGFTNSASAAASSYENIICFPVLLKCDSVLGFLKSIVAGELGNEME